MRAIVLGSDAPDSFARDIAYGLTQHGFQATVVQVPGVHRTPGETRLRKRARRLIKEGRSISATVDRFAMSKLHHELEQSDPDLVISTHGAFSRQAVRAMRAATARAKWVLWYPDAFANFGNQRLLDAPYDLLCLKDRWVTDLLASTTRKRVLYLPQGAATHRFKDLPAVDETFDVLTYGNYYPYRQLQLSQLSSHLDVRLHGNTNHVRRDPAIPRSWWIDTYLIGEAKSVAIQSARVALNTMHYGEIDGANIRVFELAAAGAVILSEYRPSLRRYFDIGNEIETFRTSEEMNAKILALLADTERRTRLRENARRTAHERHSYELRVGQLLATL